MARDDRNWGRDTIMFAALVLLVLPVHFADHVIKRLKAAWRGNGS